MRPIVFHAGKSLATGALSRNMYHSAVQALVELIFNGFDAANLRGACPHVDIRVWTAGEHPLATKSRAVSVTDNGTGFTEKVIDAYREAGESVHKERSDIHGKHGIGKFAPFALGSESSPVTVFYITTNIGDGETWMFRIDGDRIFSSDGSKPTLVKGKRPGLPSAGPFTEIFVPVGDVEYDPESLRKELSPLLPLRPWAVMVNGRAVERRKFASSVALETPVIPVFGGSIKIEFSTAEISTDADTVELIDSVSGRIIGDLHSRETRGLLDPILHHPRLIGRISVPGLEKKSSASRSGLTASFWRSARGKKLVEILNSVGVEQAQKALGEEPPAHDDLRTLFEDLAGVFQSVFGDPVADPPLPPKPPRDPKEKEGGGGGGGGGGGTNRFKPVCIRIEDATYRIESFDTASTTLAAARRNVIIVNTAHPEFTRLKQAKSPRLYREGIVRSIFEAHVAKTRELASNELFGAVYGLMGRFLSSAGTRPSSAKK